MKDESRRLVLHRVLLLLQFSLQFCSAHCSLWRRLSPAGPTFPWSWRAASEDTKGSGCRVFNWIIYYTGEFFWSTPSFNHIPVLISKKQTACKQCGSVPIVTLSLAAPVPQGVGSCKGKTTKKKVGVGRVRVLVGQLRSTSWPYPGWYYLWHQVLLPSGLKGST